MEMTTKALTLLALTFLTYIPVWGTTQEILGKIRIMRPTTLQALKDIKHNIDDELKAIKKTMQHQSDTASAHLKKDLLDLKTAKTDIKNQIRDFLKSANDRLPSVEQIKSKADQLKDDAEKKAHTTTKGSKKVWNRFIDGVKQSPKKIKNFFTGKKS